MRSRWLSVPLWVDAGLASGLAGVELVGAPCDLGLCLGAGCAGAWSLRLGAGCAGAWSLRLGAGCAGAWSLGLRSGLGARSKNEHRSHSSNG